MFYLSLCGSKTGLWWSFCFCSALFMCCHWQKLRGERKCILCNNVYQQRAPKKNQIKTKQLVLQRTYCHHILIFFKWIILLLLIFILLWVFDRYFITAPKVLRVDASETVLVHLYGYEQETTVNLYLKDNLALGGKTYASQTLNLNKYNNYQAAATLRVPLIHTNHLLYNADYIKVILQNMMVTISLCYLMLDYDDVLFIIKVPAETVQNVPSNIDTDRRSSVDTHILFVCWFSS